MNSLEGLDELLRVEGTRRFEVLAYFVFEPGEAARGAAALAELFPEPAQHVFPLHDEAWPVGVVLVETRVEAPERIPSLVEDLMVRGAGVSGCRASLCMLDGAFYDVDDLFSPEVADQIYAYRIPPDGVVFCSSAAIRATAQWRAEVSGHRTLVRDVVAPR